MAADGCRRVVVYLGHVDAGHATPFGWYVSLQWLDSRALPLGEPLRTRQRRRSSFNLKTAVAMPADEEARFLQLRVMKRHRLHRDEPIAEHVVPMPSDLTLLNRSVPLHAAHNIDEYTSCWRLAGGLLQLARIASDQRKGERARQQTAHKAMSAASLQVHAANHHTSVQDAASLPSQSSPGLNRLRTELPSSPQPLDSTQLCSSLESDWQMVEQQQGGDVGHSQSSVEVQFGMRLHELLVPPVAPVFRWLTVHAKPGWVMRRGSLYVDVLVDGLVPGELKRLSVQASIETQQLPWQNILPQNSAERKHLTQFRIRCGFALIQGEVPNTVELNLKGEYAKGGQAFKQSRNLSLDWQSGVFVGVEGLCKCVGNIENEQLSAASFSCHALAEVRDISDWDALSRADDLNITTEFEEEMAAVRAMTPTEILATEPHIKDIVFVLVGGLFTEYYPGYFEPNRSALDSVNARFVVAPIRTECGCEFNAPAISETVEAAAGEGKRVILVSHSKGGTDIHAAVSLFPQLRELVAGILLFQPVFGGTIGVEDALSKVCSEANVRILKGQREALDDLSYSSRFEFVRSHEFPTEDIPTLCLSSFVSAKDEASSVFGQLVDKAMQVTSSLTLSRTRFRSDGLVVRTDARVPGAYEVILSNMAHGAPAFEIPGAHYQAATIMLACIRLLLRIIARRLAAPS